MDIRMPVLDGFSACRILKSRPATRLTPLVLMTAAAEHADRVRAIEAGADDFLAKPIDETELSARVRSLVRVKRYTDDLESAEAMLMSLALTIEARDPHTDGHCQRLATYSVAVGLRLGVSDDELEALDRGAYLHDIGKIAVPDAILLKTGPLTADEMAVMRQHAEAGDRLCAPLRSLAKVRPIVRSHHEHLDGSGYPDGLRGDAVPVLAQIVGIVDLYDALTTWRPYREALPDAEARAYLETDVARGWRDRRLVDAFFAVLDERAAARAAATAAADSVEPEPATPAE
jgi:putative two-component system response regulator